MSFHHAQTVLGEENYISHLTPLESDRNPWDHYPWSS